MTEPQKFFIGVIDLFSILLPGAVLTYLLKDDHLCRMFYGASCPGNTEGWAVFLVTSYLLGHFIFLIGSTLLDDRIYDPIKKATYAEQIARLAKGNGLSPVWPRLLAKAFMNKDAAPPVRHAIKIKEHYLDPLNASSSVNAFQWSKAKLTLANPEAIAVVQRFEADSKFFRSLFVVLCIFIPWSLVAHRYSLAISCVPLLILAFWRYLDQRVKATNQAYWYIIALESQAKGGYRPPSTLIEPDGFTHAGGVVYKLVGNRVEYLLVQATKNPQEWVLPKGHINPGEPMRETAVREVREETGVWASIRDSLGESAFTLNGESNKVQFYLMEALKEEKPSDQSRKHVWLTLDEAVKRANKERHRELVKLAEEKRTNVIRANASSAAGAG